MEINKIRELGDAELRDEARKMAEQLFRIRFQLELGQKDGVKRLQQLKKDVARVKTISRERVLQVRGATLSPGSSSPATGRKAKANNRKTS